MHFHDVIQISREEVALHVVFFTAAADLCCTAHAHLLAQVVQAGQDYLEAPQYLLVLEFPAFL